MAAVPLFKITALHCFLVISEHSWDLVLPTHRRTKTDNIAQYCFNQGYLPQFSIIAPDTINNRFCCIIFELDLNHLSKKAGTFVQTICATCHKESWYQLKRGLQVVWAIRLAVARFDWWLYLCKDASLLMPQRASQLSFEAVWNQHLAKQKTHDSSELEETDILHKDLKPDCPVDRLLTGWSRPAKKYHWAQNWRKGERV